MNDLSNKETPMNRARIRNRAVALGCYRDTEALLSRITNEFKARHGGDWYHLRAEADAAWVDAYLSYDGRALFTTWVWVKVWARLRQDLRERARWDSHRRPLFEEDLEDRRPPGWDLGGFLERLTGDGRLLVRMVLESPVEMRMVLCQRRRGEQPRNVRAALRQFLGECGWARDRVLEAFREVRSALRG